MYWFSKLKPRLGSLSRTSWLHSRCYLNSHRHPSDRVISSSVELPERVVHFTIQVYSRLRLPNTHLQCRWFNMLLHFPSLQIWDLRLCKTKSISNRGLGGMTHPNQPPMSIHCQQCSLCSSLLSTKVSPRLLWSSRCSCYPKSSSTAHRRLLLFPFRNVSNSFGSAPTSHNRSKWGPGLPLDFDLILDLSQFWGLWFRLLPQFVWLSMASAFGPAMDSLSFLRASSFSKLDFTCSRDRCRST